jgi:hypothetical protein
MQTESQEGSKKNQRKVKKVLNKSKSLRGPGEIVAAPEIARSQGFANAQSRSAYQSEADIDSVKVDCPLTSLGRALSGQFGCQVAPGGHPRISRATALSTFACLI